MPDIFIRSVLFDTISSPSSAEAPIRVQDCKCYCSTVLYGYRRAEKKRLRSVWSGCVQSATDRSSSRLAIKASARLERPLNEASRLRIESHSTLSLPSPSPSLLSGGVSRRRIGWWGAVLLRSRGAAATAITAVARVLLLGGVAAYVLAVAETAARSGSPPPWGV